MKLAKKKREKKPDLNSFEMASSYKKSEEKSAWRTTFICRHCFKGDNIFAHQNNVKKIKKSQCFCDML